jgi:tRNA G10  N-methylase Trm11
MDYMRGLPDKAFDLAIVDPPYGVEKGNKAPDKAG